MGTAIILGLFAGCAGSAGEVAQGDEPAPDLAQAHTARFGAGEAEGLLPIGFVPTRTPGIVPIGSIAPASARSTLPGARAFEVVFPSCFVRCAVPFALTGLTTCNPEALLKAGSCMEIGRRETLLGEVSLASCSLAGAACFAPGVL
jgi:hypothetical protein